MFILDLNNLLRYELKHGKNVRIKRGKKRLFVIEKIVIENIKI